MITDPAKFKPATTEVAIICYLHKNYNSTTKFKWRKDKLAIFDKAMGTDSVRRCIDAGWDYRNITKSWENKLRTYKTKRKKYLIYK